MRKDKSKVRKDMPIAVDLTQRLDKYAYDFDEDQISSIARSADRMSGDAGDECDMEAYCKGTNQRGRGA